MAETDKVVIATVMGTIETGCVQSQEVLLHSFYARKPEANETMSHFALALQDLLSRAIPSMKDAEKNNYFESATIFIPVCAYASIDPV